MSEAEKPTPSAKIIGSTHQSNLNLPIGVPASPQALGKEAPSGGEGMLSRNSSDSPSPSDRVSFATLQSKLQECEKARDGYKEGNIRMAERIKIEESKNDSLSAALEACEAQNKKMREALEQIARGNHGVDEHGLWVQPREVATKALSSLLP